ncbi:hypothetical protein LTR95_018751, partial [Oleoguttula sp. CCFEE 5521]
LLLVGTVFFCLVVKVYNFKIGLAGLVTTFVMIGTSFGSWLLTAAIETRSQLKKRRGEPWTTARAAQEKEEDKDRQAAAESEEAAKGKGNLKISIRVERVRYIGPAASAVA